MKNSVFSRFYTIFGPLALALLLCIPAYGEAPVDSSTDPEVSDDAGISMPIASGADSSVSLYDQTCYQFPCLDPGIDSTDITGKPSPFDPLGIDTSIGSVANYPTMGSHVFLTTKDGQVVTVDGFPLGANEVGKEPRYSIVEDDAGGVLSVCDSVKQMCFIPSRIETKNPSEVSIVLNTYEDYLERQEEEKEKKKKEEKKLEESADTSGESEDSSDEAETTKVKKKVEKELVEEEPETRQPGDWDKCRSAGLSGKKAPSNKRSCINAYNNGVDSTGRNDFIPVDCSEGFVGPSLPGTLNKCPGKFDVDHSSGMRGLEEELEATEEDSDKEEQPTPNPHIDEDVDDPGDSPVEDEDVPEEEARGVSMEMINEMDDENLEGPGEQILPDIEEEEPEEEAVPEVDVPDEPVLNAADELQDREMEDREPGEPRFFDSDIIDEDGDLTDLPPDEPLDEEGEEALQELLGEEGEDLEEQAREEEEENLRRKPSADEMEMEEDPGPETIENPAEQEGEPEETPDVFELQEDLEDVSAKLLTRDSETGAVQFVENEEGQEVMGSVIKVDEDPGNVPGGSTSLSPEDLKAEFQLTDDQYNKELESCRKATNNFKDKSFEECLKENLERFADFLIRVEE